MKIFISYEHNSWPLAQKINEWLKDKYTVYWDFHLYPGVPFNQKISSFIADSDHFLIILSPSALTSGWVNAELGYAKALQKNIIPIRLEDVQITSVQNLPFLGNVQILDWATNEDISGKIIEAFQKSNYRDMISITAVAASSENTVQVKLKNNSGMDLYDVQTFIYVAAKREPGGFVAPKIPAERRSLIIRKDQYASYPIGMDDVLPKSFQKDDFYKKENLVSVLCRFSFQNQERTFSIFKEISAIEFKEQPK